MHWVRRRGAAKVVTVLQRAMSTPIVTARRNLVQRISNLLRKAENGEINLTPWQLCEVQRGDQATRGRAFRRGRTHDVGGRAPDLYEPAGFVADAPIDRRQLVDQLAAVVAAA